MKNKKGIILIILSLLIIIAGFILLFNDDKEEKKKNRAVSPPRPFSAIDARGIIYNKMISSQSEIWNIADTKLIAHNKENNIYLVHYTRMISNDLLQEYETIITTEPENDVELPGWEVGSRDLNTYNFIYYDDNTNN